MSDEEYYNTGPYCVDCYGGDIGCVDCATAPLKKRIAELEAGIREVLAYLPDSGDDPACNIERMLRRAIEPAITPPAT